MKKLFILSPTSLKVSFSVAKVILQDMEILALAKADILVQRSNAESINNNLMSKYKLKARVFKHPNHAHVTVSNRIPTGVWHTLIYITSLNLIIRCHNE